MKYIITVVIVAIIIAIGAYALFSGTFTSKKTIIDVATSTTSGVNDNTGSSTSTASTEGMVKGQETIGQSVEGRPIYAYTYGTGDTHILLVGNIHGGYEWNTALLSYQTMDWLKNNPSVIPSTVSVTVIPTLNPDGLVKTVGTSTGNFTASDVAVNTVPGRFNAHAVDINRNFACDWQTKGVWQSQTVSGGTAAFSEPESQALRDYVTSHTIGAAVVYYSAAGGVYTSNCGGSVLSKTTDAMNTYAAASGYPAKGSFDAYATTGDAVNWMAKQNIPAISVLLTNHTDVELQKNEAGIKALLSAYSK